MTTEDIIALIADGNVHAFYTSPEWRKKRGELLRQDKNECQNCKRHGRYIQATHVHHVQHLKAHPELALCDEFTDEDGTVRRQLISLCRYCHEMEHPERLTDQTSPKPQLTQERW